MNEGEQRMSRKERRRLQVMGRVETGSLRLTEAADLMGVSYRQAKRIGARYREHGSAGLLHASRGRVSNRRLGEDFKQRVLALYRARYRDFGPTLASEKMAEREGVAVHRETLRRWLLGACLWLGRSAHRRHRRRRARRARFGELVQMDGADGVRESDHAWFEERGPRACLMDMADGVREIDDATGKSLSLMRPAETCEAAADGVREFAMLRKWIERHGVPAALYVDRKNIYVANREPTEEEKRLGAGALTDFGRACWRLGIEIVPANSPQAKGRVERRNGVLQDRLVKELRLRGINDVEGANAILDPFSEDLDRRFAVEPLEVANCHHALPADRRLDDILCVERRRAVQNDWTVSHNGRVLQILDQPGGPKPRDRVTVRQRLDGTLACLYQERPLRFQEIPRRPRPQNPRRETHARLHPEWSHGPRPRDPLAH